MSLREKIATLGTKKQNSILSASLVLGITFALSAVLGLLRSKFLYAHFYNCCLLELDAYNAAFRLPDLIFKLLVTGALSASFIPVFSGYLHKDEKLANKIASNVINLLIAVFLVIAALAFIFAPSLNSLIAAGFTDQQQVLMSSLTRILLFAQIFFLLSNFITGILQVHQIFIVSAVSPLIYNFFIILSIFTLAPTFGIYGATYGAVVGAFFHFAIQLPALRKTGFKYSLIFKPKFTGVREILNLMLPRTLSLGLGEIENTITLFFASGLAAGSISLLNLALQIMYLPSRIFGTTVGQASLPILSKNIARNEIDIFRNTVRKTMLQSLFIALPLTTILLVHRVAVIRLAFGAKQFPWPATLLTAKTLAFLTPAIAAQAVIQILIRSFYALHDTKTPLKVSFLSLLANVVSAFLFVNFTDLGVLGLAISASIGNLVQCFGLLFFFIKAIDGHDWSSTFVKFGKIIIASVVMGVSTWFSLKIFDLFILDTSKTLNLLVLFILSTTVGTIFYFASAKLLKLDEYQDYQSIFKKGLQIFQTKR